MPSSSRTLARSSGGRIESWPSFWRTSAKSKRAAFTAPERARASTRIAFTSVRFSENEAFRRVTAARLVRRFPALLDAIAAGELHLTGLLMLGPHLTAENLMEIMPRAKHRTKREIARLVRVLDPLPPVPARIEPLGPAPARLVPPEASWEQFVGALSPVRELEPGERPSDWGLADEGGRKELKHTEMQVPGEATGAERAESTPVEINAPARVAAELRPELAAPQRYKVQFTGTEEYVQLVEEAKALLAHAVPRATLEDVQLRAMRAFVEGLRKRKYGSPKSAANVVGPAQPLGALDNESAPVPADRELRAAPIVARTPDASTLPKVEDHCVPAGGGEEAAASPTNEPAMPHEPHRCGRYIPAATRHHVASRDGHRCTYVDASGKRCAEILRLEFHHLVPFAVSPSHEVANLTLRCRAHNALAAEEDFGRRLIQLRRSAARHDPFGNEGR